MTEPTRSLSADAVRAPTVRWRFPVGVTIFVAGFFVLGGEFWDKLRGLFVHGARAVFPNTPGGKGVNHE